jgi:hypothetical protein
LLNKNPNLANTIVRKERSKPLSSIVEMRGATATLEQAVEVVRERWRGKSPFKVSHSEITQLIKADEFFKPVIEVADEQFFGFPKSTRIVYVKTPIGLQLLLAKDNGRYKIFWTEILAD